MMFNSLTNQHKKKDRYAYIRALLRFHDITGKEIAHKLRVSEACVSRILHDRSKSRRVQTEIARRLNLPYEELWPLP